MRRELGKVTRRELIDAVGRRYRDGASEKKKAILNEFVEVTGYHRKHAIRLFRSERESKPAGGFITKRCVMHWWCFGKPGIGFAGSG